jgi:CRISPR/Cas system CSM-associated protein Csm3 (group 7 of RAMP superfamily)
MVWNEVKGLIYLPRSSLKGGHKLVFTSIDGS